MDIIVISYSFTGNNEALASNVAKELSAEYIRILESKPRTLGTITLDVIFSRTPLVQPAPDLLGKYDLILFFGPIWMGQVATPLRAYLKYLKTNRHKYGFISISGGADGTNPKVSGELRKRTGIDPAVLIDLHIADLLPPGSIHARKDTSTYRLDDGDIKQLSSTIVEKLMDMI
ncbi:hypothetical protein A8L34_14265 [Bacillus sp. FJAT-27264]|uniref:flavodoxin family protein n=1 Tax=Paenibacillus sp. (strain DSM 101736 / FJAT-27264) TaxID=1850362 RepID=UPI000807D504|nr:hypothetical protein [Bacillus sp. FJAT-27264]OBZ15035.1 hypothetical protein A8L34_14265 [Bacillus sp. FJAT-27264]